MSVQDVETAVLQALRDYIHSHSRRIGQLGLTYEVSIDRGFTEAGGYRSEARVQFIDEKGPWDLLEFEVVRQGQLVVSVEDISKWFPDAFADVVARRQRETGDSQAIVH